MRKESFCVIISVLVTVLVHESTQKSVTEAIKEKVNALLSKQKTWGTDLDVGSLLDSLKGKKNCQEVITEKDKLVNSLKQYSVAFYCRNTGEKTEEEMAELAYQSWLRTASDYAYPGETEKNLNKCAKLAAYNSCASRNDFIKMTAATTTQIGCKWNELKNKLDRYVVCLLQPQLSDKELSGKNTVGTYIFNNNEYKHLRDTLLPKKIDFHNCSNYDTAPVSICDSNEGGGESNSGNGNDGNGNSTEGGGESNSGNGNGGNGDSNEGGDESNSGNGNGGNGSSTSDGILLKNGAFVLLSMLPFKAII